ncbi:MAG: glucose 1-dehydrogenase [Proteobacteria bacterium]|nr:glucose 1-dehydrogenase [Pseudomonadota bacterium]MCH8213873.1 glucose 1-dehydrogenase [Pseudomonadota bacterium]
MAKTVLVTGASRGIGASVATLAGRAGYTVCVNYRERADKAAEVVARIEAAGGRAAAFQADVSVEKDVVRMFEEVDARFGPVSALVNNAGVMIADKVVDMDADMLNRLWAINVTSCFLCAREAIRRMSKSHNGSGGAIVNISSIAGKKGGRGERVHYAASKGAVNTMTIGLAAEVAGEGIRVNAVLPGLVDTDLHEPFGGKERIDRIGPTIPLGRAGLPDDVGAAVVWLLSDEASFITGALLEIGGGS